MIAARLVRTIGTARVARTVELPVLWPGLVLTVEGAPLAVARVLVEPVVWEPGIRGPAVEVELEPEHPDRLDAATAAGWAAFTG